jgi:polyferredoxin
MILPMLLLFVPIYNHENFQLEGIIFLLLIGFFSKGIIHYAIAKVLGPIIWGRGFCGWACWTAAILEWLPLQKVGKIPSGLKNLRYLALVLSIVVPVALVGFFSYDVRNDYLNKSELFWMLFGNAVYYLLAIPMAFWFKDKRAFCKIACPVSLVMKVPASISRISIKPSGIKCINCKQCSKICPMDVNVADYIYNGKPVKDTECILCMECKNVCPVGAI